LLKTAFLIAMARASLSSLYRQASTTEEMDRREMDRREKRGRDGGCEEEGEVRRG
jgi:hypothetical protein